MILEILDTDILTLFARGNSLVTSRIKSLNSSSIAVTVVTVEEVVQGWYATINGARSKKDDHALVRAYLALRQSVEFFGRIRILDFDLKSLDRFTKLRTQHRRIGRNDLQIAAIVIENSARLHTRNIADYDGLDELQIVPC